MFTSVRQTRDMQGFSSTRMAAGYYNVRLRCHSTTDYRKSLDTYEPRSIRMIRRWTTSVSLHSWSRLAPGMYNCHCYWIIVSFPFLLISCPSAKRKRHIISSSRFLSLSSSPSLFFSFSRTLCFIFNPLHFCHHRCAWLVYTGLFLQPFRVRLLLVQIVPVHALCLLRQETYYYHYPTFLLCFLSSWRRLSPFHSFFLYSYTLFSRRRSRTRVIRSRALINGTAGTAHSKRQSPLTKIFLASTNRTSNYQLTFLTRPATAQNNSSQD